MAYINNWKLDPSRVYYSTKKWLYDHQKNISIKQILNSPLYKYVLTLGYTYKKNLFIHPTQSMCLLTNPNLCRIRSDQFLNKINQKSNKLMLISAIELEGKINYIVFLGHSFLGYNHQTNSSNSFINYDVSFLKNINKNESKCEAYNIQKRGNPLLKFLYFTCPENAFNESLFNNFISLANTAYMQGYESIQNEYEPHVPNRTISRVNSFYNGRCGLHSETNSLCFNDSLNYSPFERLHISPTEIHHIVPRHYFRNLPGTTNWELAHSRINLIPLCSICHRLCSGSNKANRKETLNRILEIYKRNNLYDDFIKYLHSISKDLTIEKLYQIYEEN